MASHHSDVVFPEDLDDEDEEDDEDVLGEPDDDEETDPSPSTSSALALAVVSSGENAPIPLATATPIVVSDDRKRQRIELIEEKKPLDDSRKLFQRLWRDEDEIGLLQGFLEYTTERGRGSSHHNDTALFYDQIKTKLQLGFNKNQLVEKLRRLKKKYRNVLNKIASGKDFSFKSPHDQATFEISHKIWSNAAPIAFDDDEISPNPNPNPNPNSGHSMPLKNEANSAEKKTTPSRKRSKRELNDGDNTNYISNNNDNHNDNHNHNYNNNHNDNNCNLSRSRIQGLIEETVKSCLSPLLKEKIVSSPFGARGFGVGGFAPWSLNLNLNLGSGEVEDEKWRKQQILELEVYYKRLELVQVEIKAALNELRSAGVGG